jgi:hypothetical protein
MSDWLNLLEERRRDAFPPERAEAISKAGR